MSLSRWIRHGAWRRVSAATALAGAMTLAWGCSGAPELPAEAPVRGPEPREIQLTPEAMQAAGIEVATVETASFHPHVVASGVIRPVAERSVEVRAPIAGRVLRVAADVGDRVKRGQVLAVLEGSDATALRARARTALARRDTARQSLERAQRLLALKGMSQAEVEVRRSEAEAAEAEADAADQDLRRLGLVEDDAGGGSGFLLRAPQGGTVLDREISPGSLVERDAPLFTVSDLSQVWAIADVYEKDLGVIQEKGEVEVRTDARPDMVFSGRIALIEPTIDEASRTAHVRVVLDNASGALRPGLFVTVAVPLRGASESMAVAIPEAALQRIAGLPVVFVEVGPGRFALRPIETGMESHGMVEVRQGVPEGARVVVKGAFTLKSEILKSTIGGDD